jgi:hypothetical protein
LSVLLRWRATRSSPKPATYDGDAKSDILWRDSNASAVAIWFINGFQAASRNVGNIAPSWTIQGSNGD